MNEDELKARTKAFAIRVMNLVDSLPNTISGRTVGNQLIRSGTSVAANYRAACRGRSKAEFSSKLGIALEEADESMLWLELIMERELLKPERVVPLHTEADELVAILVSSIKTSRGN